MEQKRLAFSGMNQDAVLKRVFILPNISGDTSTKLTYIARLMPQEAHMHVLSDLRDATA